MRPLHLLTVLSALLTLLGCGNPSPPPTAPERAFSIPYALDSAHMVISLSDSLREISDVCWAGGDTLLAVQDELGILFYLDAKSGSIIRQTTFGDNGDYEGVAADGDTVYVLRSDGVIFQVSGDSTMRHETGIPSKNNEGFCFDPLHRRLLIGPTSRPGKRPLLAAEKGIYAFDLSTHQLVQEPIMVFNLDELHDYAARQDVSLPEYGGKKRKGISYPEIRFKISAIAMAPQGDDLWLLSADDGMLFIYDHQGRIRSIINLPREINFKPEGIAFLQDGTLVISNEGPKGGRGSLVLYGQQKE